MKNELGGKGLVEVIDELAAGGENHRLLDPASTPGGLKSHKIGVGIPMPTRTCTRETTLALKALTLPMFGMPHFYSPDSLEVGEARNKIVEDALRDGVEWLMFIDYDVAPPSQALVKLMSLNTPISAGVYNSKQVPSNPLILVEGWGCGFEDYERGDLVKADGVGMGCALIHMDVFRKIKPPWFKTIPGYLGENPMAEVPMVTEDIYFCKKAKDAGYDIIVDTSVQCGHVDWRTGLVYVGVPHHNNPKKVVPGWMYRSPDGVYVTEYVADVDHPGQRWADVTPPKRDKGNPKIDLGCGTSLRDGYMGVDLYVDHPQIRKEDINSLRWYREEYGLTPAIHSSHALEHLSYRDVPSVFRDWVNTLAPGGVIEVWVPDGESYLKTWVEKIDAGEDAAFECTMLQHGIFGEQIGEGQIHKCIFTKRWLEQLARTSGLVDVTVERQTVEGTTGVVTETSQLYLRAVKPGGEEETDG